MTKGTKFKRIGAKRLADLPLLSQEDAVLYGDRFADCPWIVPLARRLMLDAWDLRHLKDKPRIFRTPKAWRPPPGPGSSTFKDALAWSRAWRKMNLQSEVIETARELLNFVYDLAFHGDARELRLLADAIEAVAKEQWPDAKQALRLFIISNFVCPPKGPFAGTFAQARDVIYRHFPIYRDDVELRRIFREHGVKFTACKRGRTRKK